MKYLKRLLTIMGVVSLIVVLAACSSSKTTAVPLTSTTPPVKTGPTASPTLAVTNSPALSPSTAPAYSVNLASNATLGNFLVDGSGMTLYYFSKDSVNNSTATGAVLANWPLFSPANFVVPAGLNASDFATITRADGLKVATYKGWPLYHYIQDKAAGDTLGQGVGGIWFVINPAKFPPPPTPAANTLGATVLPPATTVPAPGVTATPTVAPTPTPTTNPPPATYSY